MLQEVQRVQLAPVDQAPEVAVEIDPLAGVEPAPVLAANTTEEIIRKVRAVETLKSARELSALLRT